MSLDRVRTALTGFPGGPGVCTMYFVDAATALPALQVFWTNMTLFLPEDVTATIESSGDVIDETNGHITGTWVGDPLPGQTGFAAGGYAAPAGFVIDWLTGAVVASHRVKGRSFIVPIASSFYQNNGSIVDASLATMRTDASGFPDTAPANFSIWSRPFAGAPAAGGRPARPARPGSAHEVVGAFVPDKVAILRSRRD